MKSVKILLNSYCVLITFKRRESAENAMTELHNNLIIKGQKYKLLWGKATTEAKVEDAKMDSKEIGKSQYHTEQPTSLRISKSAKNFSNLDQAIEYSSLNPKLKVYI